MTSKKLKVRAARLLSILLAVAVLMSLHGCLPLILYDHLRDDGQASLIEVTVYETTGDLKDLGFDELLDVLFEYEVTYDNLTLNQCVSDPEALGIEVPRPATLGEYSLEATQEDNQFYSEVLEALANSNGFDYKQLSDQQRREADYIKTVLEQTLRFEEFYYYDEPLKPSTGAQATLPLSLMDYNFRTVEDIEIYFELLRDFPRYFDLLLAHEEEKKSRKLLMSLVAIEGSIMEAQAYIGDADTHVLAEVFDEMLDKAVADSAADNARDQGLAGLTDEQIAAYKARNVETLRDYVIPTYENLESALTALVPYCSVGTRLYDYYRGTEYYELKMESMGFAENPLEAAATLNRSLNENWEILMNDPNSYFSDMFLAEAVSALGDDPEDFIAYVRDNTASEFAGIDELNFRIKIAPDASPNEYAMAYFAIPPVDDPQHNIIVFFPRNISDDVDLFNTVAHEGYPGHMYQFFAYSLEEPSNISKLLGSLAYIEGWAMYAQGYAMHTLDADVSAIESYNAFDRFAYGLQARVDIGVNYEGWSLQDTRSYLAEWGFDGAAQNIYDTCIKQPVSYLPYGLGLVKFRDLRSQAENSMGRNFDPIAFNQKLMSLGPIPFDMLDEEMSAWMRSGGAQSV